MSISKAQTLEYTAYCKDCDKDIANSTIQEEIILVAARHYTEKKHNIIIGNVVKWVDDSSTEKPEHIVYCKNCHTVILQGFDTDDLLVSALQHCKKEKHELVRGVPMDEPLRD